MPNQTNSLTSATGDFLSIQAEKGLYYLSVQAI